MCAETRAQRPEPSGPALSGFVADTSGHPIVGATVSIKGSSIKTRTDNEGRFSIRPSVQNGIVEVTFLGYDTVSAAFTSSATDAMRFRLMPLTQILEEVAVHTGYESVSADRMTGAFTQIDNQLLNRRVSTNILDRIEGIASGLVFPKYTSQEMGYQPAIAIRGRSTIFANAEPLIILDNFPYDGEISNINPNDVESVTVLKDGAAASIWGAQSGNGVIVITTKQGRAGTKPTITVTANTTIAEKPDLYYAPQLSSAEYIEIEKFLFEKGAFNSRLRTVYQPVSPVVELLHGISNGNIDEAVGLAQLGVLTSVDIRDQLRQYVYQHAINQQYNMNISGSSNVQQYFVSFGYDGNRGERVGTTSERYTVNARNSYSFLNQKMTLHAQLLFTAQNNATPHAVSAEYPYELLADEAGNALAAVGSVRNSYADTAGNGRLLDWRFRPLDEMGLRGTDGKSADYRINAGLDYRITDGLRASVKYQFSSGTGSNVIWYGRDSYFVRNLVNQFSRIDGTSGEVIRPVPEGEVRVNGSSNRTAHYMRGQLNFDRKWNGRHEFSALAAVEASDNRYEASNIHLYGYDPATATSAVVDFLSPLPRYYGGTQRLQNSNYQSWTHDRFRSYVMNASYTFAQRYTLYGSVRRDESNLFGVATNQKGVPLWSLGASWNVHDETFADLPWLTNLKLRTSYGVQGNVDKSVSALLTASYESYRNAYGLPLATVENPPNPSLRWEKVKAYNAGIDFSLWDGIIGGQVDVYRKEGTDLIANSPIAAQTGTTQFRGNTADILTRGVDVSLQGSVFRGAFSWNTVLLYNYTADKVTDYKVEQSNNLQYMMNNYLNPFEGKPQSALFSFRYGGLDAAGNPLGYLDGQVSDDYTAITAATGIENMVYHGPRTPRHFGSFRNDFQYHNMFLSFNIAYRFDYYFRRLSLNNTSVYSSTFSYRGIADYANRWQAPGDEHLTDVPALVYPANSNRTNLYTYSEALVERADHIRLQDVQFGVNIDKGMWRGSPFNGLKISAYLNNLAILWRANKHGVDPDVFQTSYPVPRTYAINVAASF